MNQNFGLLKKVADKYNIQKGDGETELAWKGRLVYSLLSQIGYSSLYDVQDDLSPASIVHFKDRLTNSLRHIVSMYPEMEGKFSVDTSLSDELYQIFLQTGCLYHEPNRIRPCSKRISQGATCTFMRGQAISETKWISGSGGYRISSELSTQPVEEMFSLSKQNLAQQWLQLVSEESFMTLSTEVGFEFLRVSPPYRNGYWENAADDSGKISLARTTSIGKPIYYLYKMDGENMRLSQLPGWMTDNHNYLNVAVACLADRNTLPATKYCVYGSIVVLDIGYLFPPAELNFLKLYSWPVKFCDFPQDFIRVMNTNVFNDIKIIFEKTGYQFEEVGLHV